MKLLLIFIGMPTPSCRNLPTPVMQNAQCCWQRGLCLKVNDVSAACNDTTLDLDLVGCHGYEATVSANLHKHMLNAFGFQLSQQLRVVPQCFQHSSRKTRVDRVNFGLLFPAPSFLVAAPTWSATAVCSKLAAASRFLSKRF